jgi:hypothetical protein
MSLDFAMKRNRLLVSHDLHERKKPSQHTFVAVWENEKAPSLWEGELGARSGRSPGLTGSINCPKVDDGYGSIMRVFPKKSKNFRTFSLQISMNLLD